MRNELLIGVCDIVSSIHWEHWETCLFKQIKFAHALYVIVALIPHQRRGSQSPLILLGDRLCSDSKHLSPSNRPDLDLRTLCSCLVQFGGFSSFFERVASEQSCFPSSLNITYMILFPKHLYYTKYARGLSKVVIILLL